MAFELSCKCEYSLAAMIELATFYASGQPLQIRQIASRQNIPERYLEQLLLVLKHGGFVRSQRGMNGGYILAREPEQISLIDLVECIEGHETARARQSCSPQTPSCSVVHDVWNESCQAAEAVLANYTLRDLMDRRDVLHQSSGAMYYI